MASPFAPYIPAMRLHLVDGTFELFRAHFSQRPGHRTPGGVEAKAVVGLASSLAALLHDPAEAVTHAAVAFDNPIRSFRNDLFPGYKTEEGVPPELLAQFDAAEDAARALGLVVWPMREYEADDALASAAARLTGSRSSRCGSSRRTRTSASASREAGWCRWIASVTA